MIDARLLDRLRGALSRSRRFRLYLGLAYGWILGSLVAAVILVGGWSVWTAAVAGIAIASTCGLVCGRARPGDVQSLAIDLEARFPELDSRLLAALEQRPEGPSGSYGYLQMRVLSDVLSHARRNDWRAVVPLSTLLAAQLFQWGALFLGLWCVSAVARHPFATTPGVSRTSSDTSSVAGPVQDLPIQVEPGDVEVERGTAVLITAAFGARLPSQVELVTVDSDQRTTRQAMLKSLSDPVFGARIAEVAGDLVYFVTFDGQRSAEFQVRTFEYPRVERIDAVIQSPEYTGLAASRQPDVRRVSVVEGGQVLLEVRLNKPVTFASLVGGAQDRETVTLLPLGDDASLVTATLTPARSLEYRLVLRDAAGRENRDDATFSVDVLENLPPTIKLAFPARDVRVSPLQEVALEGTATDDFGLREFGLVYQTPEGTDRQLPLGRDREANAVADMAHRLDLEPLGVVPDELISFYFYADDVGPDGRERRSYSDMFFAEVRPFEEIYRQAANQESQSQQQQQQQQQQGQQNPSQRLIELQRQVVTAAWNLLRREPLDPPRAGFVEDVQVIAESQGEIRTLGEALAAEQQDALLVQHATEALAHMTSAADSFSRAAAENATEPLAAGRQAAQSAYRALLKLQAREHQVQRQQQSQSQQSQQARNMNRQLDELELKNDRHRYETEQQAQQQQSAEARESLQVLNRLKELARRQEDLNERIRQVEDELRNVAGDEERAELTRQLKRLQEEQEQMLRDVDELRERMNREENRARMAEARQQLDETRERVQRSSQALRDGETAQARAEGTRAERELEELQEEFRRESAGRFDESLRQLRADAQELAQAQEAIGRELAGSAGSDPETEATRSRPSLRDPLQADRSALTERLSDQQEQLAELLQQMRTVVEESESSEPLLSTQLYDAIRATRVDQPSEALSAAAELYQRGFNAPAIEAEQQARTGIENLRHSIEQAAESVLGDETEGLRRAREQLADLTDSVARELAQNDPGFAREAAASQAGPRAEAEREEPLAGETSGESPMPGDVGSAQAAPSESSEQRGDSSAGQESESSAEGGGRSESPREPPSGAPMPGAASPMPNGQPGDSGEGASSAESTNPQGTPAGTSGGKPNDASSSPGGQSPGRSPRPNRGTADSQPGTSGGRPGGGALRSLTQLSQQLGGADGGGGSNTHVPNFPLTGEDFIDWSDRMRDLEEMVSDPGLQSEIATIRERARAMRIEFKRHSREPNWELVRTSIYGPMRELEQRLAEELARRTRPDELVPIDRDPVPEEYAELVRRYYEELSRAP